MLHTLGATFFILLFFFFFNDTATTEIYTLSLHDALPISAFRRWPPSTAATSASSVPGTPPRSCCFHEPASTHPARGSWRVRLPLATDAADDGPGGLPRGGLLGCLRAPLRDLDQPGLDQLEAVEQVADLGAGARREGR